MKRWIEKLLNRKAEPAHLKTGRWGERQAVRLLKTKRYKLLGQRVRVGKHDEIDIVAEHHGTLVFVEVKTRKNEKFGRPFSAVNSEKRKHLSRAAVAYLKQKRIKPEYIRFDVVEVIGEPGSDGPEIRHIENAFPLDPAYRLWW
jgi:putative endonuclease